MTPKQHAFLAAYIEVGTVAAALSGVVPVRFVINWIPTNIINIAIQ